MQGHSDAELYWVVKNGIRMTGMPAFGLTHKEEDLWAIVAFLRRLPKVKPAEYEAMAKAAGLQEAAGPAHGHAQTPALGSTKKGEEETREKTTGAATDSSHDTATGNEAR